MKATTTTQFDKKFKQEVEKEQGQSNTSKSLNHRDLVVNKIEDLLKWAYSQTI